MPEMNSKMAKPSSELILLKILFVIILLSYLQKTEVKASIWDWLPWGRSSKQTTPTVTAVPAEEFKPDVDADQLHKCVSANPKILNELTALITTRTCQQRLEIRSAFEKKFGDLNQFIWNQEPPRFNLLLPSIFTCGARLLAFHMHEAVQDPFDETSMIDIMVRSSETAEIHDQLIAEYQSMYNESLEDALKSRSKKDFRSVLMELLHRRREAPSPVDEALAEEVGKQLSAESKKWEDKRGKVDLALMETRIDQLQKVFEAFEYEKGKNIEAEMSKFNDQKGKVYKMLINFLSNKSKYCLDQISESMNGNDVNELALMRGVLLASESDLGQIQVEYEKTNKISLHDKIKQAVGNTAPEFLELLLGFVQGPKN